MLSNDKARHLPAGDLYLELGSSHVAFRNYLRIKPLLNDKQRREALLHCWTMQPGCKARERAAWVRELRPYAPLIGPNEAAEFEALDDELIVYRGAHRDELRGRLGLSWTLDRSVAEFFSRTRPHPVGGSYRPPRDAEYATVLCGRLRKADVLLYENGRNELEIVADAVTLADSHQ